MRPGPPAAWMTSAATAAASAAAALVPKKFGFPSPSTSYPKNVVFTPSTAVICGVRRTSGSTRRSPFLSKNTTAGPGELKSSGNVGSA